MEKKKFSKEFSNFENTSSNSRSTKNKILNNEFDVLNILNNTSKNIANEIKEINQNENKFPFCLLWTKIPLLTFFYPNFGYLAIGDSNGKIHFFENLNKFSYYKFFQLKLNDYEKNIFDDVINEINNNYKEKFPDVCDNNSYCYVADILNKLNYNKKNDYNKKDVFNFVQKNLKFINKKKCFCFYLPYFIFFICFFFFFYILFIL